MKLETQCIINFIIIKTSFTCYLPVYIQYISLNILNGNPNAILLDQRLNKKN